MPTSTCSCIYICFNELSHFIGVLVGLLKGEKHHLFKKELVSIKSVLLSRKYMNSQGVGLGKGMYFDTIIVLYRKESQLLVWAVGGSEEFCCVQLLLYIAVSSETRRSLVLLGA